MFDLLCVTIYRLTDGASLYELKFELDILLSSALSWGTNVLHVDVNVLCSEHNGVIILELSFCLCPS